MIPEDIANLKKPKGAKLKNAAHRSARSTAAAVAVGRRRAGARACTKPTYHTLRMHGQGALLGYPSVSCLSERKNMAQCCIPPACQASMSELKNLLSEREDPKFCQPCWQLAYSKTAGFDPNFNPSNRWWYWRSGRCAFGRFETDAEGLFFMRGQSHPRFQQAQGCKRLRSDSTLGDTEVLLSDGGR
jgi:hypothetical protein